MFGAFLKKKSTAWLVVYFNTLYYYLLPFLVHRSFLQENGQGREVSPGRLGEICRKSCQGEDEIVQGAEQALQGILQRLDAR